MQETLKHTKDFEAPRRVSVFFCLHSTYTLTRHGVSFISFPPTDLSSHTQRGGNYLLLSETSAQFVCASHVKKANPIREMKSSSQWDFVGSKSALDQATVEGHLI